MVEPKKKFCPIITNGGLCMYKKCAWWTGKMCGVLGIGVVLEKALEGEKCESQLSDKDQSVKDIPKI